MVGISIPSYAYNDLYIQNKSLNAGFYLRIPFGPTKKNEDRLKYGLQLNMTQEINGGARWNNNYPLSGRQMLSADLISLNFSESGFRNLSLVGQKTFVYHNGVLRVEESDDSEGGTSTITWVFATIGIVTVAGAAAFAIAASDDCFIDIANECN
ncbi:MAG: hypothetical protein L3J58_03540 [Emcibacter sp.]|nr:hypothetical protein [Emcibacter sp.]